MNATLDPIPSEKIASLALDEALIGLPRCPPEKKTVKPVSNDEEWRDNSGSAPFFLGRVKALDRNPRSQRQAPSRQPTLVELRMARQRSQLKAVFSKDSMRRQCELVRLLLTALIRLESAKTI
jgi:hypothetical protein